MNHEIAQPDAPRFVESPVGRFLTAPFRLRSYANLLYLALAFPLGLAYFVFLVVGISLGLGLTIIWVGIPILAGVLAISFAASLFERQLAIHLLGADVPPMAPAAAPEAKVGERIKAFLGNPATWKGMGYLAVKFPLGVATFAVFITFSTVVLALLLAPLYFAWLPPTATFDVEGWSFVVDTPGEALVCSAFGVVFGLLTFNLFNGVAYLWRRLATALLGSERHREPAPAVATV